METTHLGKHIPPAELIAYPHDRMMPRYNRRVLLTVNKENKGCIHQFFISYVYPHQPVTTLTLAR